VSAPRYDAPSPLAAEHDLAGFRCGDAALDEWLHRYALVNQAAGSARTYVATRAGRVVGYYALSSGAVSRADAPGRVGKAMPEPVPVLLLGRLAVDRAEQGKGLGAYLLQDAILRTLNVAEQIGVRALLAHASNESAAAFYARFGFEPSPTDALHMLLLLKDARAKRRRDDTFDRRGGG
jgi:predicted N-acetyltransferase YhbS